MLQRVIELKNSQALIKNSQALIEGLFVRLFFNVKTKHLRYATSVKEQFFNLTL